MKRIVSVSMGSSIRDKRVIVSFCGEKFSLERKGTDGDIARALDLIRILRGNVDAFGLGGTDLYIYAGNRRYTFRESLEFVKAAGDTPIFDGSGLKNTLERSVVLNLQRQNIVDFRRTPVLLVCGTDRFGMAQVLDSLEADVVYGDLLFGLQFPLPIRRLTHLNYLARCIAPLITRLPVRLFYPVGKAQEARVPKFSSYFRKAKVVAGDFHFIRRNMPDDMTGKIVITNSVTMEDRELLKQCGVKLLITTTPDFGGRSFGTNVLEAMLHVAVPKMRHTEALHALQLKPGIIYLN